MNFINKKWVKIVLVIIVLLLSGFICYQQYSQNILKGRVENKNMKEVNSEYSFDPGSSPLTITGDYEGEDYIKQYLGNGQYDIYIVDKDKKAPFFMQNSLIRYSGMIISVAAIIMF